MHARVYSQDMNDNGNILIIIPHTTQVARALTPAKINNNGASEIYILEAPTTATPSFHRKLFFIC